MLLILLQDLENYILELIPTLPQLDGLEKSFYSFYVCTAVRKFFFFLDPLRTGETEPLCKMLNNTCQTIVSSTIINKHQEYNPVNKNIPKSVTTFPLLKVFVSSFVPGKIKIQDILACSFLDDLLEVDSVFFATDCVDECVECYKLSTLSAR